MKSLAKYALWTIGIIMISLVLSAFFGHVGLFLGLIVVPIIITFVHQKHSVVATLITLAIAAILWFSVVVPYMKDHWPVTSYSAKATKQSLDTKIGRWLFEPGIRQDRIALDQAASVDPIVSPRIYQDFDSVTKSMAEGGTLDDSGVVKLAATIEKVNRNKQIAEAIKSLDTSKLPQVGGQSSSNNSNRQLNSDSYVFAKDVDVQSSTKDVPFTLTVKRVAFKGRQISLTVEWKTNSSQEGYACVGPATRITTEWGDELFIVAPPADFSRLSEKHPLPPNSTFSTVLVFPKSRDDREIRELNLLLFDKGEDEGHITSVNRIRI